MARVSLVLRLKNEQEFLPKVLDALDKQTFKDFEVIAIDNASTDRTAEILNDYQFRLKMKILYLPDEKFTYPYACNMGAEAALGEVIGFLSGHSIPIFNDYLEKALFHFSDPKVAGVYGPVLPNTNATFTEWFYYSGGKGYYLAKAILKRRPPITYTKPRIGLMGNTNSLLRKDLWREHKFNENMKIGGEDTEWGGYFINKGYKIIKENHMAVRHSHDLTIGKFIKQRLYWEQCYYRALKELRKQSTQDSVRQV